MKALGIGCLLFIGVAGLVSIFFLIFVVKLGQDIGVSKPAEDPSRIKERVADAVRITRFNWRKDGFGSVMLLSFTVKNDSSRDVKDFRVTCRHSAKSGTVIDSNSQIVYDVVKAHSVKRFNDFNMEFIDTQAASSSCTLTDSKIME
jgi:hypothetical protein